jgi:ubiquinone/menaquinone biosynthesis C-methylase UbiE
LSLTAPVAVLTIVPHRASKEIAMASTDPAFAGAIPRLYDALLVPMLFQPYADQLAALVAGWSPRAVLETAAGTGVVTRALAPRLAAEARYVVTDVSPAMLEFAAARQGPDTRIEWRPVDATALPFDDASFDVVCCQFGAMFFPSRVDGYAQARRVLKPGGRFVFSVWDRLEANEFPAEVMATLAHVFPDDPPNFIARIPHGHHDVARLREDLRQAGFTDIGIQTREAVSLAPSARDVATAFCQGTPVRAEIEAREPSLLQAATDRVAAAIAARHGDGPVTGKIQAHVIVAVA